MKKILVISIIAALLGLSSAAYANNAAVSNVSLLPQSPTDVTNKTVDIQFDLSQDNVFAGLDGNNARFYDCIWIFIKYRLTTGGAWGHAKLTSGTGVLTPTADGLGVYAKVGNAQKVKWNYGDVIANGNLLPTNEVIGVTQGTGMIVRVMAIEMVYIPAGVFEYNPARGDPYYTTAGGEYTVTNNFDANTGTTNNNSPVTDFSTNASMRPAGTPSGWPNGYDAFYMMKYEISQGQYRDFLNTLTRAQQTSRVASIVVNQYALTNSAASPNASSWFRNGIRVKTDPGGSGQIIFGCDYDFDGVFDEAGLDGENLSCNYLSWDDFAAYASWCAMRPYTEMEFEKAARGGNANSWYVWGGTSPATANSLYFYSGDFLHRFYGYWLMSGYGGYNLLTDVGHFLLGDVTRTNAQTGVSVYGVTDLASNLPEHCINCAFTASAPTNGDGTVTPPATWPTANSGKRGFRANNSYDSGSDSAFISGRLFIASTATTRSGNGGRCARTP